MKTSVALVTGTCGEMGRLLVPALARLGIEAVGVDVSPAPATVREQLRESVEASILDRDVMRDVVLRHRPRWVFHLAAVLSSKAERDPDLAHRVNVDGTYGLFQICCAARGAGGEPPRFVFPSSIAVYGLPDLKTKQAHGAVKESEWTVPIAMYGCNKHYCELVGSYLSIPKPGGVAPVLDFRAIRFPGLISAESLPTGGTTDYAPQMIHAAAQGLPYRCFVREDSRLPFMTMPDAVDAMIQLASAEAQQLSTRIYNIRGFSATAGEIRQEVLKSYPAAQVAFDPIPTKQAIVDSWPADVDDSLARRDWGLAPRHGLAEANADYLVPALRARYSQTTPP